VYAVCLAVLLWRAYAIEVSRAGPAKAKGRGGAGRGWCCGKVPASAPVCLCASSLLYFTLPLFTALVQWGCDASWVVSRLVIVGCAADAGGDGRRMVGGPSKSVFCLFVFFGVSRRTLTPRRGQALTHSCCLGSCLQEALRERRVACCDMLTGALWCNSHGPWLLLISDPRHAETKWALPCIFLAPLATNLGGVHGGQLAALHWARVGRFLCCLLIPWCTIRINELLLRALHAFMTVHGRAWFGCFCCTPLVLAALLWEPRGSL